jgi:hypothetical protein
MSEVTLYGGQCRRDIGGFLQYTTGTCYCFRGGLVFEAHRHLYHSTLGSRAIKKKKSYGFSHVAHAPTVWPQHLLAV